MRFSLTVSALLIAGCGGTALERRVEALTTQVNALRADLERARTAARLTLAVHDADLAYVVAHIAKQAQVRIDLPRGVAGRLTLDVKDMPWDILLETVVKTLDTHVVSYEGPRHARIERRYLSRCDFGDEDDGY